MYLNIRDLLQDIPPNYYHMVAQHMTKYILDMERLEIRSNNSSKLNTYVTVVRSTIHTYSVFNMQLQEPC